MFHQLVVNLAGATCFFFQVMWYMGEWRTRLGDVGSGIGWSSRVSEGGVLHCGPLLSPFEERLVHW